MFFEFFKSHGIDVWYDFMWKRTRAIRKDITQQHLACRNTAHVLEVKILKLLFLNKIKP